MSNIINVLQKPQFDNAIIRKEYHSYISYLQSFQNNDEIRISIQNQDLYVVPGESFLYIEGFATKADSTVSASIKLLNNCIAHLFDEIRYELNGIEIDRTRHLGIATEIKNYVSLNESESRNLVNAGWAPSNTDDLTLVSGYFNFCVPLKMLLGFAEDFDKIIVNAKHELILLRSKDDTNVLKSIISSETCKLSILNITWKVPHIQLADVYKLQMLKVINNRQPLNISFRTWDMYYYPAVPSNTKVLWNVKLANENERPRFLLLGFKSSEKKFIHCDITNIKVHLNSDTYPYDDLNLKFDRNRFALLYDMYIKFQQSYYTREPQPLLTREKFKSEAPIIVLDVTHQNETVKTGPIDIRIELETSKNISPNTSLYCLIIHDKMFEYIPLTNEVRKLL
ncbi:uncharacterized protein LOC131996180 [Stomoxys calcitrans]|uniref:uncharacterized protein LOC131996180 n=1 Tax=Stomoxys calcitrans TaxID=35570 RepID=UPI0027E2BEAB|nr:uncharacterized protein LOC131996180 [Stomoxys calcitrans]